MADTVIASLENPQFKRLKRLAHSARERRKTGQTLLEGVHLLKALAEAGGRPEAIILRAGAPPAGETQAVLRHFSTVRRIQLAEALFDAVSNLAEPAGVMALIDIPPPARHARNCLVLLEDLQDPGNIGTILRTAAAAGADAVYLSQGCAEAWSPKALRAGMGAQFVVAVHERADLAAVARDFAGEVVATTLAAPQFLYALDVSGPTAFMFGNEGAGLSAELIALATRRVAIPMPGRVESLNAAAAAAVCLFERVRQLGAR